MGDAAAVSGGTLFFSARLRHPANTTRPPQTHLSSRTKSDTIRVTVPDRRAGSQVMTHGNRSRTLPLVPLLAAFRSSRPPRETIAPGLSVEFLDTATTDQISQVLSEIAGRAIPLSFHR